MITLKKTRRGFLLGEFRDHNGEPCSIQESSVATEPCLWLGSEAARMHLTRIQAVDLVRHLQRFIETGSLAPTVIGENG